MTFFEGFYKTIIVQGICVFIILLSIIVTKYFFKNTFVKAGDFYRQNILSDTRISEVLSDEI